MAYCSSCGNSIPEGQGSSCSMCIGDPGWGSDGYYQQYLEEAEQRRLEEQQEIDNAEEQYQRYLEQQSELPQDNEN